MWNARTCAVLVVSMFPAVVWAQGRRADYDRAHRLAVEANDAVFRSDVDPHFVGDRGVFWYRVETSPATHEFVLVDPDAHTRSPLFDAQRLAAALNDAITVTATLHVSPQFFADALPLDGLVLDPDARHAEFTCGDRRWRWDRTEQRLEPAPRASPVDGIAVWDAPYEGPVGGRMTIVFENANAGPVKLYWRNKDAARVEYATLAPGGSREQPTYEGHVWIAVDARGVDLAAFVADVEHDCVRIPAAPIATPWRDDASPDGATHVSVADGILVRRDPITGPWQLKHSGRTGFAKEIEWAPDSCRLVAYDFSPGDDRKITFVESSPPDQVEPRVHTMLYDKPGDQIDLRIPALIDVRADELHEIKIDPPDAFANPRSIDHVRWSKDSRRFTALYVARGHSAQRLLSIDATTGVVTTLVENTSDTFVDTTQKTYLHWVNDGDDEAIWMSERSGWNHLELVDAVHGGVKTPITHGEFVVKRVLHVDDVARRVWFIAGGLAPGEDPYHEHLCSASFDGSGFVQLTRSDATHEITFTPDHRYFIDAASRVDLPPIIELRRSDDGELVVPLETADWSRLLATGWRAPERFVAKGRDGKTDIWGIIVRPTNFDGVREFPIVEKIYSGPHGAHVPKAFSPLLDLHQIAELGFVVVQIDGMGTNWRSKAFLDVCWRNLSDAGLPDHIAWLQAVAAKYPGLDQTRVGIYGGSTGGMNALSALLHHNDFYSVAVADCGCHDNRMDKLWWNEAWMGYPVGPWYAENSNVTNAWRLRGKLLLMVGELDDNVDPASTMQVVNALIKADKDFELLVMPGVGHGTTGTRYGWRRQSDFLVRNLLGVEPRSDP